MPEGLGWVVPDLFLGRRERSGAEPLMTLEHWFMNSASGAVE